MVEPADLAAAQGGGGEPDARTGRVRDGVDAGGAAARPEPRMGAAGGGRQRRRAAGRARSACSIPRATREAPASSWSSSGIRHGRIRSSRRCALGRRCWWSSRAPTATSHPPGTARVHRRRPGTSPPRTSVGSPRSSEAGSVLGPGGRGRALRGARDDPWELGGDALAYARRLAHQTAPFRVRSAAIQAKAKLSQASRPGSRTA
jgi:hypothetical protein